MSSNSSVLERPASNQYERATPAAGSRRTPWNRGEPPRIPITYRIAAQTKMWLDLLAASHHVDKTEILERAIEEFFGARRGTVEAYLNSLQRAVASGDTRELARLVPGPEVSEKPQP
jgi:hypothetical protein